MKKLTAILALLLAAALLFVACGPKEPVNGGEGETSDITTPAPETTIDDVTTEEEPTTVDGESETSAEPTTGDAGSSSTDVTTTAAPTAPALPQGKAEILAAYTKVVNKVKADAPQYVSNDWQTMSNVDMSGLLYGIASTAAKSFLETKEQSTADTHAAGGHPKWFALPTDSLKEGCVLTDTSKIESANCVKSGDYYVITITLAQERDPYMDKANPKGVTSWHGRMFDVIDIVEVTDYAKNVPGLNADNSYCTFKGTATLKYNPVTNECVSLDHIIDVRIFLGSGAAKVIADYHFYDFKW